MAKLFPPLFPGGLDKSAKVKAYKNRNYKTLRLYYQAQKGAGCWGGRVGNIIVFLNLYCELCQVCSPHIKRIIYEDCMIRYLLKWENNQDAELT